MNGASTPADVYATLPDSVRDVIRRRLDRLPEKTLTVLGVLALLGRGADVELLERIVGSDADSVLDGCEAVVLVGLLIDDPTSGGFALSHDLVRQTLEDGLSSARRVRQHARIAATLQADQVPGVEVAPDRIVELAHHFTAAAPVVGPAIALEYLMAAADDALTRLASSKFSQYLATAQELTDQITDPAERRRWESMISGRRSVARLLGPGGAVDPTAGLIPESFEPGCPRPGTSPPRRRRSIRRSATTCHPPRVRPYISCAGPCSWSSGASTRPTPVWLARRNWCA